MPVEKIVYIALQVAIFASVMAIGFKFSGAEQAT